jgi:Tfp pilus assembly protein PilX
MKGGSLRSFKYVPLLAVLSVAALLTVGVMATRPTSSRRSDNLRVA